MLRAPALTIINEATPETLHAAFKVSGALERGDLPRQSIFRIGSQKPYPNISVRTEIGHEHEKRLSALMKKCQEVQSTEDPKAYDMQFAPEIIRDVEEFWNWCVDQENQWMKQDTVKGLMLTRAFVKAIKYAGIATVYNYEHDLIIKRPEWEWAKNMVMYEINGIDHFFQGSANSGTSVMDDVIRRDGRCHQTHSRAYHC
jgi:hypothetical protein